MNRAVIAVAVSAAAACVVPGQAMARTAGPSARAARARPLVVTAHTVTTAAPATIATLEVRAAASQRCSARVSLGKRSASLGTLVTGRGGGGEWVWQLGPGTASGQWRATVVCGRRPHRRTAKAVFAAPASVVPGSGSALVAPGTLSGHATGCVITAARSLRGAAVARVTFANTTTGPVNVYWLNYAGAWVQYALLAAGGSFTQVTFLTNPWLVTDAAGHCIGYTVADRAAKTLTIKP